MEQDSKRGRNMKVCLVGSSGGHLTHLYMLKPFWENKKRFWVTFDKEDAKSMLKGEKVYPCYFPTNIGGTLALCEVISNKQEY